MLASSILSGLYSLGNFVLDLFFSILSFSTTSLHHSLLAGGHLPYGPYQVWKCVGNLISKWIQKRASTHSEMTVKWFY